MARLEDLKGVGLILRRNFWGGGGIVMLTQSRLCRYVPGRLIDSSIPEGNDCCKDQLCSFG